MNRILLLALVLAAMVPGTASARGGRDRGQQGAVPPSMREPWDPTPPLSGPPRADVPVGGPADATPPPNTPRVRTPRGRARRKRDKNQFGFSDWSFWYAYNRESLEPRTKAAVTFSRDRAFVAAHIVPALLEALADKDLAPQARSAACVALGKVASHPDEVTVLRSILSNEAEVRQVRESATIAMGLLRRTMPSQQFKRELLDHVRSDLKNTLHNEKRQAREQGFAVIALALLASQPSALPPETASVVADFAFAAHGHPGLSLAGLTAMGLLAPASLSDAHRKRLRDLWQEDRGHAGARTSPRPAFAAIALGRLGSAAEIPLLTESLGSKRRSANELRSALIALGALGSRLDGAARLGIVASIKAALKRKPLRTDATAENLAFLTLARLGRAQAETGEDPEGVVVAAGSVLLAHADAGRSKTHNTSAAVGLGWLAAAAAHLPGKALISWRKKVRKVLLAALEKRKLPHHDRAGHDLALGYLAEDEDLDVLVALLRDRKVPQQRRAACATALARHGEAIPGLVGLLTGTVRDGRSEVLLSACVRSLGRLSAARAEGLLAEKLVRQRSLTVKGTCAIALANLGTESATKRLVELAKDPAQDDATRAIAYAGLGLVGDPEATPTLGCITADINWRMMQDIMVELCALL